MNKSYLTLIWLLAAFLPHYAEAVKSYYPTCWTKFTQSTNGTLLGLKCRNSSHITEGQVVHGYGGENSRLVLSQLRLGTPSGWAVDATGWYESYRKKTGRWERASKVQVRQYGTCRPGEKFGQDKQGYFCEVPAPASCPAGSTADERRPGKCKLTVQPEVLINLGPNEDSGSNCAAVARCGNPIYPGTGNKYQKEIDYLGAGANRLTITRHYNSRTGDWHDENIKFASLYQPTSPTTSNEEATNISLPRQWAFSRGNGKTIYFPEAVEGHDSHGLGYSLKTTDLGFTLTTPDNTVETYSPAGMILTTKLIDGCVLSYSYDAAGKVSAITDQDGKKLTYSYFGNGRTASITDPAGKLISYLYDTTDRLIAVKYQDGSVRSYQYEHPIFNQLLTGIVAEDGELYASWTYDEQGRATGSEHANGVERVTVKYIDEQTAESTNAAGLTQKYAFQTVRGRVLLSQVSASCVDCGNASTAQYGVDENGRQSQYIDQRGAVTQIRSDPYRLLETERTEAFGTSDARTTTTEWHPTFRLPTRITDPRRRIDFSYDSEGKLLQKTITDLQTGASHTERTNYDAQGRVVEYIAPSGQATRYAYSAGNLESVTDSAGLVTRYSAYDPHGRPQTITRPDGVVIKLHYDLRGRLLEQQLGSLITRYSYTATGLLSNVTHPDGQSLTYSYDAAHRLVGIRDKSGNQISYVLDAMGNVLREDIQDTSGTSSLQVKSDLGTST